MNWRTRLRVYSIAVGALCAFAGTSGKACTIFVLADPDHALFFNNEDWENPRTRIWFQPAGKGFLGCAYVGFDNGWAQGGVNTEGLAFDWVAGFSDEWRPADSMHLPRGNPSQRMLETCATVKEAVAFFRTNREPGFGRARILIADRTGASAIIGASNGQLTVEESQECRGFGYAAEVVRRRLAAKPEVTVASGVTILKEALQEGTYATKYSNVFDLKSGDIYVYELQKSPAGVKLNLAAELARGPHYYDIPLLREQLTKDPKELLGNMRRFPLDAVKLAKDTAPEITKKLQHVLTGAAQGKMESADFTIELWRELAPQQAAIREELKKLGNLISMKRAEAKSGDRKGTFRYRIDFANATTMYTFVFDEGQRIASIETEDIEPRPGIASGSGQ